MIEIKKEEKNEAWRMVIQLKHVVTTKRLLKACMFLT